MNTSANCLMEEDIAVMAEQALKPATVSEQAISFLTDASKGNRWAIGKNEESQTLFDLGLIEAIIDDTATVGQQWNSIPLVPMKTLPAGALVANCSSSIAPVSVHKKIASCGLHAIAWRELVEASKQIAGSKLSPPKFVQAQKSDWSQNQNLWSKLCDDLADEKSRQTLKDVLCYRLSGDLGYMQNYSVRLEEQYFENFLNLGAEVFIDAGGYDGDTTELFCRNVPNYSKVHVFEPSPSNMKAAKFRLAGLPNIEFHEVGVSNQSGVLGFNADAGSACAVGHESGSTIQVVRLDEVIQERVSYIKMDLEGWELPALQGASRLIEKYKPKLAIAVYHDARDFLTLWQWAKTMLPESSVYLRHYTEGWSETVMYIVPTTGGKHDV